MIKISNLSYSIGDQKIFDNINVSFSTEQINVILGPSGCGKTTLLRLLSGLEGGKKINDCIEKSISSQLHSSFIFQDLALWPHLTVYRHLALMAGKNSSKEKMMSLLERLGLSEKAHLYPQQLSGGQQQRLAIARGLVTSPSILYLDEPFSNLDFLLKNKLSALLKELSIEFNMTIFYVTHQLQEAVDLGDSITFLKPQGKLFQVSAQQLIGMSQDGIATLYQGKNL